MKDMPLGAIVLKVLDGLEDLDQICSFSPNLLKGNHIWGVLNNPLGEALLEGGSYAIDVDGYYGEISWHGTSLRSS